MKLLSINAGSSSLKFRLYDMPEEKLIIKGTFVWTLYLLSLLFFSKELNNVSTYDICR